MAVAAESADAATSQSALPLSYNNTWYPVAYSEQLQADEVFATRLWNEPVVLYRDAKGEPVCVRDVCPHRSAPLSMGDVSDGVLRCFYHGWGFSEGGQCVDVPTIPSSGGKQPNWERFRCTSYSVVEHDGLVWVWRGNMLAADISKLPKHADSDDVVFETTLDYGLDWAHVVEKNLFAPYQPWLVEGTSPPFGLSLDDVAANRQGASTHNIQTSHLAAPTAVRHTGSGGTEEAYVVPVAPGRSRVLLRQRLKKGPLLTTLARTLGASSIITALLRRWNYQVGHSDTTGRPPIVDEHGMPQPSEQFLFRDAVAQFWDWHSQVDRTHGQPYFLRWNGDATPSALGRQQTDADGVGTYGLKKSYVQDNPIPEFAPLGASRR